MRLWHENAAKNHQIGSKRLDFIRWTACKRILKAERMVYISFWALRLFTTQ